VVPRSIVVLALALLLPVLGADARAGTPKPAHLVLALADMPAGFSVEDAYRPKPDVRTRLDWIDGYQAEFGDAGSIVRDRVRVSSTVMIYRSLSGSRKAFTASLSACGTPPMHRFAVSPTIGGDNASVCLASYDPAADPLLFAIWRDGVCTAAVSISGLSTTKARALGVTLAHAQERRMLPRC
jgi:hypothetical protein